MIDKSQQSSQVDKLAVGDAVQGVFEALAKLEYGTILLSVHQGKLVEVAITERRRFDI